MLNLRTSPGGASLFLPGQSVKLHNAIVNFQMLQHVITFENATCHNIVLLQYDVIKSCYKCM